jgi:amidase
LTQTLSRVHNTMSIATHPFNSAPRLSRRAALQMSAASMLAAFTGCRMTPAGVSPELADVHRASATELARLLRQRKVSATELCRSTIARIDRLDGRVNAVVVRDFERALSDARSADAALARGVNLPLLGIPMTVKESFDLQGHPTTAGLKERRRNVARRDAEVVRRAKAAGAIVLGKTNVPVQLRDFQSFNPIYGRTGNPYLLSHSPGGSSGGSAAAIAMGFSALEIGSDFGGSIRVPAGFCGVHGLKTSFGTVSSIGHGVDSDAWDVPNSMQVIGPIARSPADILLLLDVIAGPDVGTPATSLVFEKPRQQGLSDYRVFLLDNHPSAQLSASILAALQDVERTLIASGATVTRNSDRLPDLAEGARTFLAFLGGAVPELSANDWDAVLRQQAQFHRQWAVFFEHFDVVLAPVFATNAFPHDETPVETRSIDINGSRRPFWHQIAWCSMASLGKLPAAVAPVGVDHDGLPIGVQVIARFMGDLTAVHFASLIAREIPPPALAA